MTESTHENYEYDPNVDHSFDDTRVNELLEVVTTDPEINALVTAQNVNAVTRMQYSDHGPKHIEIVRNHALHLYELLKADGVEFNGALQQGLSEAFEPVILLLAATLHDIGHVVHRENHSYYSIPLAADIMDRLLGELYSTETTVRVKAEVLHAILCHHTEEHPLTREAGIIRIADGLDMERGRSRIPYESGGRGINTLSSQAIENVRLLTGEESPVLVEIEMVNAAGVYQVDNLLKAKLEHSLLEDYVRIVAVNTKAEDMLVERIEL